MTTMTLATARQVGRAIGQAIARDVMRDTGLPVEWTGLDPQDGDQLTAAGIEPRTPEWDAAEDAAEEAYREVVLLVCGCQVQYDHSGGQGHCWRDQPARDIPATIREEIEAEIITGGREECDDFVGSNGCHYRW